MKIDHKIRIIPVCQIYKIPRGYVVTSGGKRKGRELIDVARGCDRSLAVLIKVMNIKCGEFLE
jgi:hypothetical protein